MFFLSLVQHVSREHQVRNGGLQPVPRNHLAHLRRAVVGELEMRSPGLEVHVEVSVQHRRADASHRHAVKAWARVNVQHIVVQLLVGGRGELR